MHPQSLYRLLSFTVAALPGAAAYEDPDKATEPATPTMTPCVATSTSGAYFDLRPVMAVAVAEGEKEPYGVPTEDYLASGYDYGYNFTLNLCGAVVEPVEDVVRVDEAVWRNVSAYYESYGKIYSLGQESGELVPRGRKLVLQYAGGSPCGLSFDYRKRKRALHAHAVHEAAGYRYDDYDDDDGDEDEYEPGNDDEKEEKVRRKSATISFLCDHDPDTPTTASFVGTDPDECAYFFEVRSQHACPSAEPHKRGSVGPGSVFAIIFFIAVLVYVVGGIFYQRTVAHARGWRQLPNYSLWSGIWGFTKEVLIILTSSCARIIPMRRGYRTLSVSPNGRHRSRDRDDENRLIDQLDEEWDD